MERRRRILLALALLAAAILSSVNFVDWLARPVLGPLDVRAEQVIKDVAGRAAAAFAVSKTINAALSFAEEVTVSGGVVFLEGSMQPAAALAPVNNLVDQFARIMLVVAATALLIELLLQIGAGFGTSLLLALTLLLFAVHAFARGAAVAPRIKRLAYFAGVLVVVVRVVLPLTLVATGAISDRFLDDHYQSANQGLQLLETRTDAYADAAEAAESESWAETLKDSVRRAYALVRETFADTFQDVVTIVTVFALETIVLPLLIALMLWRSLLLMTLRGERRN